MKTILWRFHINGTNESLYEEYELNFNPFPQHGFRLIGPDLALQSLAMPGMTPEKIQKHMEPYFVQDFIDEVIKMYMPNEVSECVVVCDASPIKPDSEESEKESIN